MDTWDALLMYATSQTAGVLGDMLAKSLSLTQHSAPLIPVPRTLNPTFGLRIRVSGVSCVCLHSRFTFVTAMKRELSGYM